jgi:hypothetical protein
MPPPPIVLPICDACRRASHERCVGCTGCGCVRSAQYAHHIDGDHKIPQRP